MNGLFPIGTVVLLKESTKRLMITGVAQYRIDEEGNRKLYDYVGVVFPEGFLSAEENFLFNADQIDKLYFVGFQDAESMAFIEKAEEALKRLREQA
ncbi:MAG: DUF4176 domain-containing protein [Clostridiales bacterium]|nr:DUF4176 domain-containing protein [Clostridiales bacterium]